MLINDRFTRGLIAGITAGIIQDSLDYISYLLDLNQLRYLDWIGIMLFSRKPVTTLETLLALGGELFFSAVLGILFVYLVPLIRSKHILIKSWIYGVGIWFGIYGLMTLFKVRGLASINAMSALSDIVTSSVYGLVLGYTLVWINQKPKSITIKIHGTKYHFAPDHARKQDRKVHLVKPKKL